MKNWLWAGMGIVSIGFHTGASLAASIPVTAKRVFLRTLPADNHGYYLVWNSSQTAAGVLVTHRLLANV